MADTGTFIPAVPLQFLDTNGDPASGGFLFVYLAGTTTKSNSYTTSTISGGGEVANANPVVLDSAGRAVVFLNPAISYKFVLAASTDTADPPASPLWTRDKISSLPFYNVSETIATGSATIAAWGTSGTVQTLTVPRHPVVISCSYDTPTDAVNLPAGTLGTNDDAIICEWEVTYSSADLDARATMFGTNVDLGISASSVHCIARYVAHRQTNTTVVVSEIVSQNTTNILALTTIGSLDLDANAYTIELTMASGSFAIRGHRIIYVPSLADWTL